MGSVAAGRQCVADRSSHQLVRVVSVMRAWPHDQVDTSVLQPLADRPRQMSLCGIQVVPRGDIERRIVLDQLEPQPAGCFPCLVAAAVVVRPPAETHQQVEDLVAGIL